MKEYRINPHNLQILPEGSLPKGTYYYRVSAETPEGVVDLANMLKVYAPYTGNALGIFWDSVPGATAYRIYRRPVDTEIEKSLVVDGSAYFYDTGVIEFE